MEFVYADVLKARYRVFGEYYRLDIGPQRLLCRRRVEIVTAELDMTGSQPDAVLILMNPGNIRLVDAEVEIPVVPSDRLDELETLNALHALKPDNTQYQLMRLMRLMGWYRLRLINLSDVCDANSQSFASRLSQLLVDHPGLPHSILDPQRQAEWRFLMGTTSDGALGTPVPIAAWGSNSALEAQALECLERIPNLLGLPLDTPWFRFASPYRKDQKLAWLEGMHQLLTES